MYSYLLLFLLGFIIYYLLFQGKLIEGWARSGSVHTCTGLSPTGNLYIHTC